MNEELMLAYQKFLLLASEQDYNFAGMMIRVNPPSLVAIGNVTQKGHELANLLRKFADMLDEKTKKGLLQKPFFGSESN
jgi:hypothetical protein